WIGIGLTLGALVNWIVVSPRLREQTERYDNSLTIPQFLSNRFPSRAMAFRVGSALIVVVFFSVYTASGLVAGGKLAQSAFSAVLQFGWVSDYSVGGSSTLGGVLAVSLTDFVQGMIMMLALIIMPAVVLLGPGGGGLSQATQTLATVGPDYLSWFSGLTVVGFLSAVAWGLGYFGQPHIIVRFMALRSVEDVPAARNIGM